MRRAAFAIVHTCMYDAWAAYDDVAVGTRAGGALRRPSRGAYSGQSAQGAELCHLPGVGRSVPTEKTLFDVEMGQLGYDPLDVSSVAAGVGIKVCRDVLAFRHGDGANQLGDLNGGEPYSDYTGYAPINDVDRVSDPSRWQPLRASTYTLQGLLASRWIVDGAPQVFLAPHWGLVTPFALTSADQFPPEPPAEFGTARFEQQVREIVTVSANPTDRQKGDRALLGRRPAQRIATRPLESLRAVRVAARSPLH